MSDQRPSRLGKVGDGKPRKFAPKKRVKKEIKKEEDADAEGGAFEAAAATGTSAEDERFTALLQRAKETRAQGRPAQYNRTKPLQVAFGAQGQDMFDTSQTILHKGEKPATEKGASASGRSGGSKATGGSSSRTGNKAAHVDVDLDLMDLDVKMERPPKLREPLFDDGTHYPTVLPFREVETPQDPDVLCHDVLPTDLAAAEEPPEPNSAKELNLLPPMPDGHITVLQLPTMLPSLSLLERMRDDGTAADNGPCAHDVLRRLPNGKVGTVKVTKKGKVLIEMGAIQFIVNPGITQRCQTQLQFVNLKTGDAVLVGEQSHRAVAAVDLDTLLK